MKALPTVAICYLNTTLQQNVGYSFGGRALPRVLICHVQYNSTLIWLYKVKRKFNQSKTLLFNYRCKSKRF